MKTMSGKTCLVTGATSGIGKETALLLARTSVYLASSPGVAGVTGGYFVKCKPAEPSALARDSQAAARLWALSEELAGYHM
jgi:NAD(P)-dependent dehydrogenase (short-subunit alcohol dehydrogenase family)